MKTVKFGVYEVGHEIEITIEADTLEEAKEVLEEVLEKRCEGILTSQTSE